MAMTTRRMCNHSRSAACVGVLLTAFFCQTTGVRAVEPARRYEDLVYAALPGVIVPAVRETTLANGMRILLLENHELPVVRIVARIHVGSEYEPAGKVGLAAIVGAVMRTGGTPTRTGDQLDEELEGIAATLETRIDLDAGQVSVSVLRQHVDQALAILGDVLMHPAFPEDKIALTKMQIHSAIARRNDAVVQIAQREFNKLIYGPESPYARHAEHATVEAVTRKDVIAFYAQYVCPDHMVMAASGDFMADDMIRKLEKTFADWNRHGVTPATEPPVAASCQRTIGLIRKTEVSQSTICLGHMGSRMIDPDSFALTLMSQILAATPSGRLFRHIRSQQGLAYTVGGAYAMNYSHPGVFLVGGQTQSKNTIRVIRALLDELNKITQEEVTDEELTLAKESYVNSFVFKFDSLSEIVDRVMLYEYYGYPADFLQRTKRGIEAVTKADILRVAKAHLHPDQLQILVVGKPEDFDEPLTVLGTVKEIDVSIPPAQRR